MTKMFVDPTRPGIIRWDDDPMTGILAGMRAAEIVRAVNAYPEIERLRALLTGVEISLARDENVDGAMKLIVAYRNKQTATKE